MDQYTNSNKCQYGGRDVSGDDLTAYIQMIVDGDYKDHESILEDEKNTMPDFSQCIAYNNLFVNDTHRGSRDTYIKRDKILGTKNICFERLSYNDPRAKLAEADYLFKKQFSLRFTDVFIKNALERDDLSVLCNHIFFILDYAVERFKEVVSRKNYFKNTEQTKVFVDNTKLYYKSGNTTKFLVDRFVDSMLKQMKNKETCIQDASIKKLKEIQSSSNIGDFDYGVIIDDTQFSKFITVDSFNTSLKTLKKNY